MSMDFSHWMAWVWPRKRIIVGDSAWWREGVVSIQGREALFKVSLLYFHLGPKQSVCLFLFGGIKRNPEIFHPY